MKDTVVQLEGVDGEDGKDEDYCTVLYSHDAHHDFCWSMHIAFLSSRSLYPSQNASLFAFFVCLACTVCPLSFVSSLLQSDPNNPNH